MCAAGCGKQIKMRIVGAEKLVGKGGVVKLHCLQHRRMYCHMS